MLMTAAVIQVASLTTNSNLSFTVLPMDTYWHTNQGENQTTNLRVMGRPLYPSTFYAIIKCEMRFLIKGLIQMCIKASFHFYIRCYDQKHKLTMYLFTIFRNISLLRRNLKPFRKDLFSLHNRYLNVIISLQFMFPCSKLFWSGRLGLFILYLYLVLGEVPVRVFYPIDYLLCIKPGLFLFHSNKQGSVKPTWSTHSCCFCKLELSFGRTRSPPTSSSLVFPQVPPALGRGRSLAACSRPGTHGCVAAPTWQSCTASGN